MQHGSAQNGRRRGSRTMLVFLAFLGIALFFLLSEHRIHALSWLPLILLAACPLLHMFMHGGHGGHGGLHAGRDGGHGSHEPNSRNPALPLAGEKI
jgi:hypothetical protein